MYSLVSKTPDRDCQPVKRDLLRLQLGNGYNQRYMAMDDNDLRHKTKQSLFVDEKHANDVKNVSKRSLVQSTDPTIQWTCQTTKTWLDLGANFFPRHVRSVMCSTSKCWYQHFQCRPKNYKIQVLKKKDGVCLRVYSRTGRPRWQDFWEPIDYQITVGCECGHWWCRY